ncbi:MAG: c-type cytochrome [Planctomycetaceae bacterium]
MSYRLQARGSPVFPSACHTRDFDAVDLAEQLASGRVGRVAARLIYERRDTNSVPTLRDMATNAGDPVTRIRAYAAGWPRTAGFRPAAGIPGRRSSPCSGARHIRLCEPRGYRLGGIAERDAAGIRDAALRDKLLAMTDDVDPHVRYQLAFTLGELPGERRLAAIAALILSDGGDPWMRIALRSSLRDGCGTLLETLLANSEFAATEAGRWWITQLAGQIARQQSASDVTKLVAVLGGTSPGGKLDATRRELVIAAIDLKAGTELEQQIAAATGGANREWIAQHLAAARIAAEDANGTIEERTKAIARLALAPIAEERDRLAKLLSPAEPLDVQRAAISVLTTARDPVATDLLLDAWTELSPTLRPVVEESLLAREDATLQLLRRGVSGEFPVRDLQPRRLTELTKHTDPELRKLAGELLRQVDQSSRAEVVARYRPALTLSGDATRGAAVFQKTCAACHQVGTIGKPTGPNLLAAMGRGKEFVLTNLLDPNREVNPDYISYTAVLTDGRVLAGMIVSETPTTITLRAADSTDHLLLRIEIESLRNSGVSLMPEGLEKQLEPQAVADLFTFLQPPPETEGER